MLFLLSATVWLAAARDRKFPKELPKEPDCTKFEGKRLKPCPCITEGEMCKAPYCTWENDTCLFGGRPDKPNDKPDKGDKPGGALKKSCSDIRKKSNCERVRQCEMVGSKCTAKEDKSNEDKPPKRDLCSKFSLLGKMKCKRNGCRFKPATNGQEDECKAIRENIREKIKDEGKGDVSDMVEKIMEKIKVKGKREVSGMVDKMMDKIKADLGDEADKIKAKIEVLIKRGKSDKVEDMIQDLIAGGDKLEDKIKGALGDKGDAIKDKIKGAVGDMGDAIKDKIKGDLADKIKGGMVDMITG